MAYTTNDAIITLNDYLGIEESDKQIIENTKERGFVLSMDSGEQVVIFSYPLVHKQDNTKTYFDSRDSGAKERQVAWEFALERGLKYFCLGVNSAVEKYEGYVFSLECDERAIEILSGTKDGERNGPGNQIIIPNDFVPSKKYQRIQNRLGIYISVVQKDYLYEYMMLFDNRPYLDKYNNDVLDNASKPDLPVTDFETYMIKRFDPKAQKDNFHNWMCSQVKANGQPYSPNTINSYIGQMEKGYSEFEPYKDYTDVFQIQSVPELKEYTDYLFNAPGFDEFNDRAGNKACSCGLVKYRQFLEEQDTFSAEVCYETSLQNPMPRNRIIFGAPGTGKSYTINKERIELLRADSETNYERVTFHPDYSYANFVGTYKPVPCKDSDGKDSITYEYVPGPFMRIYVKALKNGRTKDPKPFLLIIEEINRADVAAVFGDIFQLLDRGDNEVSEYPIEASEDIKKYLSIELGGEPDAYSKICLPNNLFIWATMNSADQGVFPMDTAFKRRWDFTYLGIDDNEKELIGKKVILGKGKNKCLVEWNKLRKAINSFLADQKINEDKQLGPYFISGKVVAPKDSDRISSDEFISTFKNKVLMYLFEDAARQKRSLLFPEHSARYSEICKDFDEKGIYVFCRDIYENAGAEKIDDSDSPASQASEYTEENG